MVSESDALKRRTKAEGYKAEDKQECLRATLILSAEKIL